MILSSNSSGSTRNGVSLACVNLFCTSSRHAVSMPVFEWCVILVLSLDVVMTFARPLPPEGMVDSFDLSCMISLFFGQD